MVPAPLPVLSSAHVLSWGNVAAAAAETAIFATILLVAIVRRSMSTVSVERSDESSVPSYPVAEARE
jgi:hypothetical protein